MNPWVVCVREGMGMELAPVAALELHETGSEPEFFVTDIARVELAGAGSIRLYVASERHGTYRLEYTVVIPMDKLAVMAQQSMEIVAVSHNTRTLAAH